MNAAPVLVIEDEPRIASLVERGLTAAGMPAEVEGTGSDALESSRRRRHAAIVLDLALPDVDGLGLLQRLVEERPEEPIVVLTAIPGSEVELRCRTLGAADFVEKPFELGDLVSRVRQRVEGAGVLSYRAIRFGDIRLDLVRRKADAGQGQVDLSTEEFALLHELVVRRGEVCSRVRLMKAVWGCVPKDQANIVDVHVRTIRSRLRTDAIESVPSEGYRIRPAGPGPANPLAKSFRRRRAPGSEST
jgi:DNA-binding response OmpR family regulator